MLIESLYPQEDLLTIIDRLQRNLALPYELKSGAIESGVSIGVATNIAAYQHVDDILRDADTAMYRAKTDGGNQYQVFDDQHEQS